MNFKGTSSIGKFKKGAALSSVLTAVSVLSGLASIFVVVYMMSLLRGSASVKKVLILGGLICALQIVKAVFYAMALWKAHEFAYSSLLEIRLAMIDKLKKLPMSFFQRRKTGDLANIVEHDVERIELYLAHTLPDVVITNLVCLFIFIVVTLLNWRLGIALVSTLPIVFVLMPLFGRTWAKLVNAYQTSIKTLSENVIEYIGSISVIKAFGGEETRTDKILASMREYIESAKKAISAQTLGMSIIMLLMETGIVIVAIVGSVILTSNEITEWSIMIFIFSIILAAQFAKNYFKSMGLYYNRIVFRSTMSRVDSVMDEPVPSQKSAAILAQAGDICFDRVAFAYAENGKSTNVLKDITTVFEENSINAVVGPSGAGKSTLANLIMGFWQPDQGLVSIGGKDVKEIGEKDLARLVSIVQQDTFLFNGSIEENIKLGNETASHSEIVDAATKACVHDVIMGFPKQYQTEVGESGARLSGGERQRVAIARMILKNASIVILDEATAAIDPYNEHLIQSAIDNLCKDKTLIIITHHLNVITSASQILVMHNGKIVAKGKHGELTKTSELYQAMLQAEERAGNWDLRGGSRI